MLTVLAFLTTNFAQPPIPIPPEADQLATGTVVLWWHHGVTHLPRDTASQKILVQSPPSAVCSRVPIVGGPE